MEVYLLSLGDHLPDPVTGRSTPQATRLRDIIETAVAAERWGLDGVAVGEHHFDRYIVSAPELLLAAIATRTRRIRLATAVTLLAHADPVRVAEQFSLLDALSCGRAELTVARGVSSTTWMAFGSADEADVRYRFAEGLQLLLRLLSEKGVTWQGRLRPPLTEVTIQPRPRTSATASIWMGGGLSTASADLAAMYGLPLMLPSTLRDPLSHLGVLEHYRRTLEERGLSAGGRVGLPIHLHVAETMAVAERTWRPYLLNYATFAHRLRGTGRAFRVEELLAGPAVCGDSDHVVERLLALRDQLGLDLLLIMLDIGGAPQSLALETLERFATEVLPKLREATWRPGDRLHSIGQLRSDDHSMNTRK